MNGETLTYDEIIERSKKDLNHMDKKLSIGFLVLGVIWLIVCYIISKDLGLSIVTASIFLLAALICFLLSVKKERYGIDGYIQDYKDEINDYNLVFGGYKHIFTKKHIISMFMDEGLYVRIVEFDNIDSMTTKKYMGKILNNGHRYFNVKLKDGKTVILYMPDVCINLLSKYITNKD